MKIDSLSPRTRELLASSEGVAASAIASATKKLKEQQDKEQEDRALNILQNADTLLKNRVETLRDIRKREAVAKKAVDDFDTAFQAFIKDGDVVKLAKDTGISETMFTKGY